MLNQVVLVGRLVRDPVINKASNNETYSNITVAVPRSYKNANGEYDTDFINCMLWKGIAENTVEYCKKGDIVGIKGRIQTSSYTKDDTKEYITEVLVEKLSFVMSKKNPDKVLQLEDATLE